MSILSLRGPEKDGEDLQKDLQKDGGDQTW